MAYLVSTLILVALLTVPVPLVAWYCALGYLHDNLERLWVAPILLLLCLTSPCIGFAMMRQTLRTSGIYLYMSSHLISLMAVMFSIIVFRKSLRISLSWMF
ncbi:hypothetical protein ASF61_05040 [Duganella sp. Leaf126]|uniref:hypothetical protein n=1 Tax=Duganella sp. Leaf126 TaxID=1736266 RepID=UPI0006F915D4|nr:hypothetical protein [Duganella sp. Leaf126]KQQ40154.1 hypothetical protein ASF61_05040 [Duganella sp. Leaf126]